MKAKKIIGLFLCVAMVISMFAMTAAFAVEDGLIEPKGDPTIVTSYGTRSDEDIYGNVYTVLGYSTYAVCDATVYTQADVTKYVQSENVVSGYDKTLYANGVATYNLVFTGTFGETVHPTNLPDEARGTETYNGPVTHVYGDHGFSCEGAYIAFPTQIPTFMSTTMENDK